MRFSKRKKLLLFAVFFFLLTGAFLFGSLALFKDSSKTWELVVTYEQTTQTLSLKSVRLLSQRIAPVDRLVELSPFILVLLDEDEDTLYQTKVHISQQVVYNIINEDTDAIDPLPTNLDSILYVPYNKNGVKIRIEKDSIGLLEISLPHETSLWPLVSPSYEEAAAQGSTCAQPQVVFMSDNYINQGEFKADVDSIKSAFATTAPFSSYPNLFDYKTIENAQSFGCGNSIKSCFLFQEQQIIARGRANYPNAYKFIVIAEQTTTIPLQTDGVLGITTIGGQVAIFAKVPGYKEVLANTAVHEFLGHSVGLLYDRYVWKDTSYGQLEGNLRSNCTISSAGETFWQQAGGGGGFFACMNPSFFAPKPVDCPTYNQNLASAGRNDTVMSAVGCGGSSFDAVEQYWIRQRIIPLLTRCPSPSATSKPSRAPTSTPTSTPTPTPSPTPLPTSTPTPTPTPPMPGGTTPAPTTTRKPTPKKTPTPTPIPYTCREEQITLPFFGLQMKRLVCEPR